jgi:hypothetical protein
MGNVNNNLPPPLRMSAVSLFVGVPTFYWAIEAQIFFKTTFGKHRLIDNERLANTCSISRSNVAGALHNPNSMTQNC